MGLPVLQAVDGRPRDGLRRGEVRLANRQADDVIHLGEHVEESADAGRSDAADAFGEERLGRTAGDAHGQSVPTRARLEDAARHHGFGRSSPGPQW